MEYNFIKKRADTQYTDIENFNEYEFRSCVAYELVIRNTEVIGLIKKFYSQHLEKIRKGDVSIRNPLEIESKIFKQLELEYFLPTNLYLGYHFFDGLEEQINTILKKRDIHYKRLEQLRKEDKNLTEEDEKEFNKHLYTGGLKSLIFRNAPYEHCSEALVNEDTYTICERRTDLFYELFTHKDNKEEEAVTNKIIKPNYSRPELHSFHQTALRDIELNLSLPKKELVDFISRLSDSFHNDKSFFQSVNNLFKIDTEEKEIKFSYGAKKVADMFFIYDYVTYFLEDAISYNKTIEEKLLDPLTDTYDKEKLREDLSLYVTAKQIIDSDEYGTQLSRQLSNKSKRTIEDDYNTIHNIIQENAYKSLILS